MLTSRERLPALDGWRGIAILLVLLFHFGYLHLVTPTGWAEHAAVRILKIGWSGVDLFFVLSGFLITGILYDARGSSQSLQSFYVRRALRIVPLYYLCIAGYLLAIPGLFPDQPSTSQLLDHQAWFWFYGSNLLNALGNAWNEVTPYYLSTMWSLAVEEQFYLVWPLLMLGIRQHHARWCLIIAAVALLVRVVLYVSGSQLGSVVLMPARMDAFALGGWLVIVGRERGLEAIGRFASRAMMGAGALGVLWWGWSPLRVPDVDAATRNTVGFSVTALFFAGCIGSAVAAPSALCSRIGQLPVLQWFGRYSYGLYILHCPVRVMFDVLHLTPSDIVAVAGVPRLAAVGLFIVVGIACSAGLAVVSWHCLEAPILSLKRYVPYGDDQSWRRAVAGSTRSARWEGT